MSIPNSSLDTIQNACIIFLTFPIIIYVLITFISIMKKPCKVYLVDHASFKPKKCQEITRQKYISTFKPTCPNFTDETLELISKLVMTSGFGDMTYQAEAYLSTPPNFSTNNARLEAEAAMLTTVKTLLTKTRVKPQEIGILVVNCSLFNPISSLTSMIINKFKLMDEIKSFNLSGMGCSAGLVAIDLAHHLLKVHKNTYALVVSTETLAQAMYMGNELLKQAANCLFRVGGSAILLSNKASDKYVSKYQLMHSVRTNTSSSNTSYRCIHLEEDSLGLRGINLNRGLVIEVGHTIKANVTLIGHLILPLREKILFGLDYLWPKKSSKPYKPNFVRVIDHFVCVMSELKPVIDALESTIKLDVEAARMTLHRFGNTSSSSVWYGLAYLEAKRKIKKSDRIWQIAFGSGFKCNSVIWRALKNVDREEDNPWNEEIDLYPIYEDFKAYPLDFDKLK
uniref:3-ketoacyl-CoA synthase n=1 Tax=Dianthus caryophyllus TaxID=3570 RepID=D4QD77_DIACA|nr:3-ketoacyl-CoA synthase [Dianthus caryophyllus]